MSYIFHIISIEKRYSKSKINELDLGILLGQLEHWAWNEFRYDFPWALASNELRPNLRHISYVESVSLSNTNSVSLLNTKSCVPIKHKLCVGFINRC